MWWDTETSKWRRDGIQDDEIQGGKITFKTIHFKPTALVQDTFAELPYANWSISHLIPTAVKEVVGETAALLLKIAGKISEIEIAVHLDGSCQLVQPASLASYFPDHYTPAQLLQVLNFDAASLVLRIRIFRSQEYGWNRP